MDRLKYLNPLKDLIWDTAEQHLKDLTKTFLRYKNAIDDLPPVCLYGKCTMMNRIIARKHIAHIFDREDRYNKSQAVQFEGKQATVQYTSYHDFIEIDIENVVQSSDKMILPEILKQITSQKSINGKRHVIVLQNVDSMNKNMMHAMRKVLETYSENAYIIMSCKTMSGITDAIKSRCVSINCGMTGEALETFAAKFIQSVRPELVPYTKHIILKAEGDIVNVAILMELGTPDTYIGHITNFIESRFMDVCKSPTKEALESKLREFCTKITAACIPLPIMAKKIIDFTAIHCPECLDQVISLSAEMEHRTIISNKMLFAMELYLHELVILLRTHFQREAS
jgi:hypothetical protein